MRCGIYRVSQECENNTYLFKSPFYHGINRVFDGNRRLMFGPLAEHPDTIPEVGNPKRMLYLFVDATGAMGWLYGDDSLVLERVG